MNLLLFKYYYTIFRYNHVLRYDSSKRTDSLILRRLLFLLLFSVLVLPAKDTELAFIKTSLQNKFLEYYPALQINDITIKPLGNRIKDRSAYQLEKITISGASLKRNHGTFSVLYQSPKKKKKRYFKFDIDATLGVYVTRRYLKREHVINADVLEPQQVVFKNFSSMPINEQYFDNYEAKRSIKEGKIITLNDVRLILDIKRGELVDATLHDGSVVLNFKVKAIEEGSIGDIIKVKRGYYKKFRARITSANSVDILE